MRVVVIGAGMAGMRLCADLVAGDPGRRHEITVFGAEPEPPYNRVLLSSVLAETFPLRGIAMPPAPDRVRLRMGHSIDHVNRGARVVRTVHGDTVGYDVLVFATGSTPVVPTVPGLAGPNGLPAGALTFRTAADCRAIVAAARQGGRAVVLGGGPLGVEAARALVGRGMAVDLVHQRRHLLDRHLDKTGSRILGMALAGHGVRVHVDASVTEVLGESDTVSGVRLADGQVLDCGLLVLACGTRPEVELAKACGLAVNSGVVVDNRMRSITDPAVYAVGDCAEHDGVVHGLLEPAWDQASIAAASIAGWASAPRQRPLRPVLRLKTRDIELAAMGESAAAADADHVSEVVVFTDQARGVYKKLVLRDGVIVGAVLLGDLRTIGAVTDLFDRVRRVPPDPAALLFDLGSSGGNADEAIVCRCNAVSAAAIRACGGRTVSEVADRTRATTGCGGCAGEIAALLGQSFEQHSLASLAEESVNQ
ncbi:FAD-dependent oxidoreductase [Actinokineospora sp.]|uniref:FAD-dependent oxidoreductase n=1 Tax=Actinokineospora sp. TaxID=1872133 RepID=UPI003D6C4134